MPTSIRMINKSGFSLLEVMIVLAIITGIVVLGITNLTTPERDVRSDIRNLLLISKRLSQQSQMEQIIYRLVLDFQAEKHAYWVEKTNKQTIPSPDKLEEISFDDDPSLRPFQMATDIFPKKRELPDGFSFKKLILMEQALVFTDGLAYIHFFPQGLADAAALQISNENESLAWTLIVNPLTGATQLVDGLFEADQLRRD